VLFPSSIEEIIPSLISTGKILIDLAVLITHKPVKYYIPNPKNIIISRF
jgi:hypothetical protein